MNDCEKRVGSNDEQHLFAAPATAFALCTCGVNAVLLIWAAVRVFWRAAPEETGQALAIPDSSFNVIQSIAGALDMQRSDVPNPATENAPDKEEVL